MRDPNYTSIEIGPGTYNHQGEPVKLGRVKLSLRHRLRFLVTGEVILLSTPTSGFRVDLSTPKLRNLPLFLVDKFTKRKENS